MLPASNQMQRHRYQPSADCSRTQGRQDFPPHTATAEKPESDSHPAGEEGDVVRGGSTEEYLTRRAANRIGLRLALKKRLCGLLLRDRPRPPPRLRVGCSALHPCAEEASAGNSMGAVLAGIPTTPSTTSLPPPPPPPPRCPTETGASPGPADGRRH
ncbi:uncharacterized protein ACO6RY_15384 [Pungitius sinensis]